jgi:hypothetical protein
MKPTRLILENSAEGILIEQDVEGQFHLSVDPTSKRVYLSVAITKEQILSLKKKLEEK